MQEILEGILDEPVLQVRSVDTTDTAAVASFAYQLRFAALKNLASIFAELSHPDRSRALALYHEALTMDQEDIVMWNRMGSLVCPSHLFPTV